MDDNDGENESTWETVKNFFTRNKIIEPFKPEPRQMPVTLTRDKIDAEIKAIVAKESGVDRVKELFLYDETIGRTSPFLQENERLLGSVAMVSFILGAVFRNAEVRENFAKNTQLTIYTTKSERVRAHVDYIYMHMVKGGLTYAIKYTTFSGCIVVGSMIVQAYRNKTTVLDYTVSGALTGALFRMHHGLTNFAFGSVVGGLFGTVFGVFRYFQLAGLGMTYEAGRYKKLEEKIIIRELLTESIKSQKEKK